MPTFKTEKIIVFADFREEKAVRVEECVKPQNPYFAICLHVMCVHPFPPPTSLLERINFISQSFVTERNVILLPETRINFFCFRFICVRSNKKCKIP